MNKVLFIFFLFSGIAFSQGKLELTTKAEIFINKLINEKLLKDEYKVLKNIGSRKVTDEKIKMMIGGN